MTLEQWRRDDTLQFRNQYALSLDQFRHNKQCSSNLDFLQVFLKYSLIGLDGTSRLNEA